MLEAKPVQEPVQANEAAWFRLFAKEQLYGRILETVQDAGITYGPIKEVWVQQGVVEFVTSWTRTRRGPSKSISAYTTVYALMESRPSVDTGGTITFPTLEGQGRIHAMRACR